jgi:phosphonate transport system substrate-binding protein
MKKILAVFFLLLSTASFAAEGVMKFGVLPSNPNSVESLQVFVKFLSEKTGQPFELAVLESNEMLDSIGSGSVSFADLTSSVYTMAKNVYKDKLQYVATVAARNEKGELVPYYKGVFFALKDSPYSSVIDMKGRSFGFVSKTSTSGYFYPVMALNQMGIEPDTFFGTVTFTGDHAKIFEGLKSGFLDGGVSNYESFEKAKLLYGNIFKVIGATAEIPSGAVVAAPNVDKKLVKQVGDVLVGVKPTDPIVNYPGFFYKAWLRKGGGFYEFVKNLLNRSIFTKPGAGKI